MVPSCKAQKGFLCMVAVVLEGLERFMPLLRPTKSRPWGPLLATTPHAVMIIIIITGIVLIIIIIVIVIIITIIIANVTFIIIVIVIHNQEKCGVII